MPLRPVSGIREWWSARTPMERRCTVISVVASIICVLLTVAIIVICVLYSKSDICLTEGCVTAASEILRSMDQKVDLCDNFYDFVCGNYVKENTIPDSEVRVSRFIDIANSVTDKLRSTLEETSNSGEARSYKMAKTFFKKCMDTASIEKVGLTRVKDLLKKMGGWPVLEGDSWDESRFSWKDAMIKIDKEGLGSSFLFNIFVAADIKNSARRVLYIQEASLDIDRRNLIRGFGDKLVAAIYSYDVDIAKIFGADPERAKNELKEVVELQIKLAGISSSAVEERDHNKLYNPIKAKDLDAKYQFFHWREIISSNLPPAVGGIHDDDTVIVTVPEHFKKLESIIKETPKRVQANYQFLDVVKYVVPMLTDEIRARALKWHAASSGIKEMPTRWKECVQRTTEKFPPAVGSLYVKKYFKGDAKQSATEMVNNIREQMYKNLEMVDWMDDETRKGALEKAKSMKSHIAYPDELLDDNEIDREYEGVDIADGESYLEATLKLNKLFIYNMFRQLREPVNKTDWRTQHDNPVTVNAQYTLIDNSVQISAGILQGAFFSPDRPNYLNYGGIGFVIGHEVTHGFDDQGRRHDYEGNLRDWWDAKTAEEFLKKAACIVRQYGNYTAEQVGLKLNGVLTQGENIADNGGAKLAYRAYGEWARRHGGEQRLPGLEKYTSQQMFWIAAANIWCSKERPEFLKQRILSDVHPPPVFRVCGTFSNLYEFDKDFGCAAGSKMNPNDKCQVW